MLQQQVGSHSKSIIPANAREISVGKVRTG